MRMFGPDGNPQAQNLFAVLSHLQEHARVRAEVRTVRRRGAAGTRNVGREILAGLSEVAAWKRGERKLKTGRVDASKPADVRVPRPRRTPT
jgi:hypothetical protein